MRIWNVPERSVSGKFGEHQRGHVWLTWHEQKEKKQEVRDDRFRRPFRGIWLWLLPLDCAEVSVF